MGSIFRYPVWVGYTVLKKKQGTGWTMELDVKKFIHQNCDIASNKDFKNGTVKILNGEENALTVGEQLACRKLRKTNVQDVEEI